MPSLELASTPITIVFLVIYILYFIYLLIIQAFWPTTFCKYIEEKLSTTCSATSIITWYSYIVIFIGIVGSILYYLETGKTDGKTDGKMKKYALFLFLLIFLKQIVYFTVTTLSLLLNNLLVFLLIIFSVVFLYF